MYISHGFATWLTTYMHAHVGKHPVQCHFLCGAVSRRIASLKVTSCPECPISLWLVILEARILLIPVVVISQAHFVIYGNKFQPSTGYEYTVKCLWTDARYFLYNRKRFSVINKRDDHYLQALLWICLGSCVYYIHQAMNLINLSSLPPLWFKGYLIEVLSLIGFCTLTLNEQLEIIELALPSTLHWPLDYI